MPDWTVHTGDCLEVMATLPANSVDAVVTDPPYGIAFMGKAWDHAVPGPEFFAAMLRVAKPGAHLVSFGGTRLYHRMTCAMEDAGWEIRDCLMWLYGSGFPKSHNGDWGGTALKPAWEPIVLARKPLDGTVAANHLRHGCGGLNVDGCRVGTTVETWPASRSFAPGISSGYTAGKQKGPTQSTGDAPAGRWPANLILGEGVTDAAWSRFFYCSKAGRSERWQYLTCNCENITLSAWENADQSQADRTDATSQKPDTSVVSMEERTDFSMSYSGSKPTDLFPTDTASTTSTATSKTTGSKTFSASHSPNTSESTQVVKNGTACGSSCAWCAEECSPSMPGTFIFPPRDGRSMGVAVNATSPLWSGASRCDACGSEVSRTAHPTQKPEDLMRWLCRLVTPTGGTVLDPFTGSGSTGKAARMEGFGFIGIEREPEYAEIARARITNATSQASMFAGVG